MTHCPNENQQQKGSIPNPGAFGDMQNLAGAEVVEAHVSCEVQLGFDRNTAPLLLEQMRPIKLRRGTVACAGVGSGDAGSDGCGCDRQRCEVILVCRMSTRSPSSIGHSPVP